MLTHMPPHPFFSLTSIPDINQEKAYIYTTHYTNIKIHIRTQFFINRATNKCRLTISIGKVRNSRIVKILVRIWRER